MFLRNVVSLLCFRLVVRVLFRVFLCGYLFMCSVVSVSVLCCFFSSSCWLCVFVFCVLCRCMICVYFRCGCSRVASSVYGVGFPWLFFYVICFLVGVSVMFRFVLVCSMCF